MRCGQFFFQFLRVSFGRCAKADQKLQVYLDVDEITDQASIALAQRVPVVYRLGARYPQVVDPAQVLRSISCCQCRAQMLPGLGGDFEPGLLQGSERFLPAFECIGPAFGFSTVRWRGSRNRTRPNRTGGLLSAEQIKG